MNPDGTKLAYITWNHPNMPWDDTTLRVVELDPSTGLPSTADSAAHDVVAGAGGGISVMQPSWSPKTGELFFVSDSTDSTYW